MFCFHFLLLSPKRGVELGIIQQSIHLFHWLHGENGQKGENVEKITHGGTPALAQAVDQPTRTTRNRFTPHLYHQQEETQKFS